MMGAKVPLPAETVDGLLKALLVLARAVDQVIETRAVEEAANEPLSQSKVQVLRLLAERGRQTSSQLARFLGVSKPAVTQIVDAMVRSKRVVRRATKEDRREVALELTKDGKETFRAVRRKQRHLVRSAVRSLNVRDTQRWTDALQRIAGSLTRADRAFEHYCLQCGAHADGSCVLVGGDATCLFLKHHGGLAKPVRTRSAKR